jgi:hypothetical protein
VSERLLQRLANGGRTGVFLATLAITVAALLAPAWIGAPILVAIIAVLAVLMLRTRAVTEPRIVAMRATVLAVLVILVIVKAMH